MALLAKRIIVVISDLHLSAGKVFEGKLNPYEEFRFDDQLCDLINYFMSGPYEHIDVELFINGDFFDFLNVPYQGEFEESVTEELSVFKLKAIMQGHPLVMNQLRDFVKRKGKTITYLIGNHDADLFFPSIREMITRAWDPDGNFPSAKVNVIADRDRLDVAPGVQIHHGNQFEAVHILNFQKPILTENLEKPILNLPWGSFYVLKIVNQLKSEREFVDKVRPIKSLVILGLLLDTFFTLKFVTVSLYYFFKTRFIYSPKRQSSLKVTAEILRQASDFFQDLERPARKLLEQQPHVNTIVFGHTHKPMCKVYPDGKQYINTGSWTKMVNLDFRSFGTFEHLTFCLIQVHDNHSVCELRKWVGNLGPHYVFDG